MRIGVPREMQVHEYGVGLTPDSIANMQDVGARNSIVGPDNGTAPFPEQPADPRIVPALDRDRYPAAGLRVASYRIKHPALAEACAALFGIAA